MSTTTLVEHPSYSAAYFLLTELLSTKDIRISDAAETLLGDAVLELSDFGADAPAQALLPVDLDPRADPASAFRFLDELLARLLLDTSGLELGLRLTRVRDLITQARRIA